MMLTVWPILLKEIEFYLVPICFVCAWGISLMIVWSILGAIVSTVRRTQIMHQIPCANCIFFSGDYHLKCSLHPKIALSEQAIDCPDFQPFQPY